jgi:hypothetical protein
MSYRPFGQWRPKEQRAAQQIADLTARNTALVAALKEIYLLVPRAAYAAKLIADALAAEERAAKAAKDGGE